MNKKTMIFGAVLAAFLMLMIPNISAVNEQVKESAIEEKAKFNTLVNMMKDKLGDGQYDWPLLCLVVLGVGIGLAILVFVLSLAVGKIGTALSNAIATLVGFLQIVAAIFAGIGFLAGAAGTLYVWIDYFRNVQAKL